MKKTLINRYVIAVSLLLNVIAGTAIALPPIVIYNFTPPAPVLQMLAISPADHQEFTDSPGMVKIIFSQGLDPTRSSFTVFDPYNNPIATGASTLKDSEMQGTLPPHLLAGAYRIDWKATCTCGTGSSPSTNPSLGGTTHFIID